MTTLTLITGATCPSCGRDNSADSDICNSEDCAGVQMYDAAQGMAEALKTLREDLVMLRDGEWQPDNDSCNASIDLVDSALAKAGAS